MTRSHPQRGRRLRRLDAVQRLTFTIAPATGGGHRPHGTGKTTLFKLLTASSRHPRKIVRRPGVRVTLLEQHRDFGGATTVWEGVAGAFRDLLALEQSLATQADALAHTHDERAMSALRRDPSASNARRLHVRAARRRGARRTGFDPEVSRTRRLETLSAASAARRARAAARAARRGAAPRRRPTTSTSRRRAGSRDGSGTERSIVLSANPTAPPRRGRDTCCTSGGARRPRRRLSGVRRAARGAAPRRAAPFDKQQKSSLRRRITSAATSGQNTKQRRGGRSSRVCRAQLTIARALDGAAPRDRRPRRRPGRRREGERRRAVPNDSAPRVLIDGFTTRLTRGEASVHRGERRRQVELLRAIVGARSDRRPAPRRDSIRRRTTGRTSRSSSRPHIYDVITTFADVGRRSCRATSALRLSGDECSGARHALRRERARVALAVMMLTRANFLVLASHQPPRRGEHEALEDALADYEARCSSSATTVRCCARWRRSVGAARPPRDGVRRLVRRVGTARAEREHAAARAASRRVATRVKEREKIEADDVRPSRGAGN